MRSYRIPTRESPAGLVSGLSEKLNELENAVGRQAERFTAVLDIGTAISSARDVEQLLKLVMDRLSSLLSAEASTLFMLDPEKDELWSRVLKGSTLKEIRIPATAGIAGHVVQSGKTLLLADAYDDIRFNPEIDRQSGFRTRSMIAAPLRHVSGRILGVVEVLHRKVGAFNQDDRALVEAVASQIAAVLDNVLLMDQLRSQNDSLKRTGEALRQAVQDLDVLYEIERAVTSTDDEAGLLDRILGKAIATLRANAGSILLLESDALFFRSTKGEKSESLTEVTLKPGQGIAGHVAETGEVINVDAAEDSPHYDKTVAKKLGVEIGAVLCVPIVGEGEIMGALELLNKRGGFSDADARLATLIAGQAGRAIAHRKSRVENERRGRLAAIGQMLASLLHDLRTPMTVIAGYAELMAEEQNPEERQNESKIILAQLEHLNSMTRETLAFARGERQVLIRKVYLHTFVADVFKQLEQEFKPTKVELKLNPGYTGVARFDDTKIKRVIFNMARNAIQAMPKGGKFTFGVEKDREQLVLTFADNGPGIPEEIAGKLFESFVTAGKASGTGLGLAIVKTIAEEHGGTVDFKSKPGKGTTFEVRIPLDGP
ncbi:MAG: GAF domain-containing sensor histidine kinase [Myxococcaceae bacterium]|nr:GAF domain-containing sensor histidine kinase [Myxococcaceae bacterium]